MKKKEPVPQTFVSDRNVKNIFIAKKKKLVFLLIRKKKKLEYFIALSS
jgi:hypothetical protein